jgi:methylated-DNA-[protein]-cysteine S-methyltransferase
MMKNIFFYDTKIGKIAIIDNGVEITHIEIAEEKYSNDFNVYESDIIKNAANQLYEYLDGSRTSFELSLNPYGTEFQRKVWKALCEIPYGETRSYKQVAETIGNSKASRAVGMANNKNPIMIIIPCHRVVGSNGSLVGYAGGMDIKEKLLNIEKKKVI